jgi:hypothetical protein
MSLSPTTSDGPDGPSKRRRTNSQSFTYQPAANRSMDMSQSPVANGQMQLAIPKRGQRACTACRKGKNRCEGDVSKVPKSLDLLVLTGPPLPARPGVSFLRHLVVDASSVELLAYLKNLRRKMLLQCLMQASSKFYPCLSHSSRHSLIAYTDGCLVLKVNTW